MAAFVEDREEEMSSGEMKEKEKEKGDNLLLFVDFGGADLNVNVDVLQKLDQIQVAFDSESENPLKPETVSIIHGQDSGSDNLLNSLNNITDYDWLLSPRRHLVPSSEMDEEISLTDRCLISDGKSPPPDSKPENNPADGTLTTDISPKLPASASNGVKTSSNIRRPSPSPSTGSRSATQPTLTKPLTPSSQATVTKAKKPVALIKRSTTPTPRPVLAVTSKSTSRSSTPTQRPSITASAMSALRSSTPTQRPSLTASAKSTCGNKVSSAMKSCGSSSSIKSRSYKNPPEMLQRSASASRIRPTVKLPVTEMNLKAVPKRTSCSPCRGHGGVKSRHVNEDDDVNPVLMGTKMVERVVNMRKLAPPRQDHVCNENNTSGKLAVSQDNSGFGRSLSKKSFDMALRHLDIRRSMPGNMRASITKIPASSVYSVRPESSKSRTLNASDYPLATSSSASSDLSETRQFSC